MDNKAAFSSIHLPILAALQGKAQAAAAIAGSLQYRFVTGTVRFYQTNSGVVVYSEIGGLPTSDVPCQNRVFGFHIHEGASCTGEINNPFSNTMAHYNPGGCEHPHHAGDLPVLFENNGFAFSIFLTNRFTVSEVIGRTIIIHENPDDFTTQPSGNSGTKIACGTIHGVN